MSTIIIVGKDIKEEARVEEFEKLRHMLEHWAEHNEEHAQSYSKWVEKAEQWERPLLAAALKELVAETRRLGKLFELALKECK